MRVILFLALLLAVSQAKDIVQMREEAANDLEEEEWDEEDLERIMPLQRQTCTDRYCGRLDGLCQSPTADNSTCQYQLLGACSADCVCCIDCQADNTTNCYTNNGKCKKIDNCGLKEYLDENLTCNSPSLCGCCRKCDTPAVCQNGLSPGFCIGNTDKLTEKHYRNTTASCTQSGCSCYNRCVRKKFCSQNNGRCIASTNSCRSNETRFECGCRDSVNCVCCIRTAQASGLTC